VPITVSLSASSTRVHQTQSLRLKNPSYAVASPFLVAPADLLGSTLLMETESRSLDVPYGDAFVVHTIWTATETGGQVTLVTAVTVRWVRSVWIPKSMSPVSSCS
jgi:hypothetical protein